MTEYQVGTYLNAMTGHKERILLSWRKVWVDRVFPNMMVSNKWVKEVPNVSVGDVVHVKYENRFGRDNWRIGRIQEVIPDQSDVVRSALVRLGLRKHGQTALLPVPVQRLAVTVPTLVDSESATTMAPRSHDTIKPQQEGKLSPQKKASN